jgi:hypothetical protein
MRFLSDGLMGAPPERPCDDVGWSYAVLRETLGYSADFLNRPADEGRAPWRFVRFVFLGAGLLAWY